MVTYWFVIIKARAQKGLEAKFRQWQKMLISLRSNPQTTWMWWSMHQDRLDKAVEKLIFEIISINGIYIVFLPWNKSCKKSSF